MTLSGATGVLYRTDTNDDIQQFVSNTGLGNKYAIIMPYWLLTIPNIETLRSSKKLVAIIAVVNGTDPAYTSASRPLIINSPDSTCPNCEFGLYANTSNQHIWNPTGTGLLYQSYNFPIYALNTLDERNTMSYNAVMQAVSFNQINNYSKYPLRALQFNSFMWAAQDSATCLRRGWCTPVGGASVWSTPSFNISSSDGKPIVVVSAAMDSRSLFHDLTLGVESSIAGMVAMLAVAEALSRSSISLDTMPKHILYTMFTAEAWGFSGSQRFVQDISTTITCIKPSTNGQGCSFPYYADLEFERINPSNIDSILEFGQIGGIQSPAGGTPVLYAHVDNIQSGASLALMNQVVQAGSSIGNATGTVNSTIQVQAANSDGNQRGLPPSSSMSFLKYRADIPTVVLTDYRDQMSSFTSQDLDDSWDPVNTINTIQQAASTISKTAWLQAQGVNDVTSMTQTQLQAIESIQVNTQLIQDLLYCLTLNYSCPLINNYLNVTANGLPARLPHYTGTLYSQSQPFPIFVWNFLANMTRVVSENTTTGCSSRPNEVTCGAKQVCVGDQCIMTLTNYHDAFGVGIAMAEDSTYYIKDASKPTWTESTWDPVGLRLFNVISPGTQKGELVAGIVLTLVSIGAVWYSRRFLKKTLKLD
ncbi:hypothetical protein BGZ49_008472 [Haplosporangium sp. Z 27]|nr:hypothetical protein BGZ49_008472 [Haplosporangium sp. Z 27]